MGIKRKFTSSKTKIRDEKIKNFNKNLNFFRGAPYFQKFKNYINHINMGIERKLTSSKTNFYKPYQCESM